MGYDKYAVSFVMLEEQNNAFSFRTALPIKGHIKIETGNAKGAMRIVVQNLRYYERGPYVYKLILFGKKRERTIYSIMGNIDNNRYGNGETYIRFDPADVDGKGNPLSIFTVAIVVAISVQNEKESLHPILKGEIEREEGEGLPDEEAPESREPCEKKVYNDFYNRFLVESCQRTLKMWKYYDGVTPFSEDRTKCIWKKILNVGNLPIVSPGAHCFAAKYKHYLFGNANERCYIGIPGRMMKEEQPDGGESGFVFWQPIIGADKLEGSYGYWIVAVNMHTGDVEEV